MKLLTLTVFLNLTLVHNFGLAQGRDSGGGSGIAAEITRATDEFIRLVRENPRHFPGVDANYLASFDPTIKVTGQTIEFCDKSGVLEADTNINAGVSRFNLSDWLTKDWKGKVHLAGHERLVLAKLERSNRYDISNRIFAVFNEQREKKFGPTQDLCSLGSQACAIKNRIISQVKIIIAGARTGEIRMNMAKQFFAEQSVVGYIGVRTAILVRHGELRQNWSFNREAQITEYAQQLTQAFEVFFDAMKADVYAALESLEQPNPCVAE